MGFTRWTKEEEQFLIDNFAERDFKSLSEQLGRTEGALRAKCCDLGLVKKDRWTDRELEYLKRYYSERPTKQIAQSLGRTPTAINIKARKLGLKKYPYTCDYGFFKNIDTEEKAYWLGFIAADGWLDYKEAINSAALGIELQFSDRNHLKKFNKSIKGNYKITDRWRNTEYNNEIITTHTSYIRIYSADMYKDLLRQNITCKKSLKVEMPELPDDLIRHYIRGYFDGDGAICYGYDCYKINGNERRPKCSLVSGSEKLIQQIREYLYDCHGITSHYNKEKRGHCYKLGIHTNYSNTYNFINLLYKDCSIYLSRKFNKYNQILTEYYHEYPAN